MNIITALVTPFNSDLSVDYNSLSNLIKFQEKSMVDGLLILGTTSEVFSLTLQEKMKICSLCFSLFSKTKIIGIEGNTKEKIFSEIDLFKSFKPDYFLVTPPYFNKGNDLGIIKYFTYIADYSPVPIFIYNIPFRSGLNLKINILKELSKHKNIAGIKNASFDKHYNNDLSLLNNNNFSVLSGNDETLLENLVLNNHGLFSVISNIIPNYVSEISNGYNKNIVKSSNMFKKLIPIFNILNKDINPYPIKKIMSELGIIKSYIRDPFFDNECDDYKLNEERKLLNEYFTSW